MKDIVFGILQTMLRHSPERSYQRLNPALRSTLGDCIRADLPFKPDTFKKIYNELRGYQWFGDGAGSHVGENFYSLACECNHASAQQSFEAFAGRPGCLWEEDAKTPIRLYVGAQFTWRGHYVTVTSMRKDGLIACTYKGYVSPVSGIKVGATISRYLITSAKRDGSATVLRVVKAPASQGCRDIAKRFTITYAEITEMRKTAKARLKTMLVKIAECDPAKDAEKLTKEINAAHFRHFELEDIRAAFQKRKEWIASQEKIEAWRKGANGAWLDVKATLIRVNGDRVECSNGNSISKAAAAAVLPVLLASRKQSTSLDLPVESYRVNRVNPEGVKIGCTFVPWAEIDRITPELAA